MNSYQKLYTGLFNAITAAIDCLEKGNYGMAKEMLISAQIRAEEAYLAQG